MAIPHARSGESGDPEAEAPCRPSRPRRLRCAQAGVAVVTATAAALSVSCVPDRPDGPETVAPYVYLGPRLPDLAATARATLVDRFVLSFLLARDGRCQPVWPRDRAVADPELRARLDRLRETGGAVTVASGGARGAYLENACPTARRLADAYRTALEVTGADRIDVDVERRVPAARVAEALALTREATGAGITVTVRVPGPRRGIAPSVRPLLRELSRRRVAVTVNAMVMNMSADGARRTTLIHAAETVAGQIGRIFGLPDRDESYARLGLTFMAGRDDTGAVTTVADARALRAFAAERRIGFLGFWSLNRDNGDCPGRVEAVSDCSGLDQRDRAFTRALIPPWQAQQHRVEGAPS